MTLSNLEDLSGRNCSIWQCTTQTRQECLDKNLFGEPETSPRLRQAPLPRLGDVCFLLDLSKDELLGVFIAKTDIGTFDPQAWGGRFKKQIRVYPPRKVEEIRDAAQKLKECGVRMQSLKKTEKLVPVHFVHPPEVTRKLLDFFSDNALPKAPAHPEAPRPALPHEGLNQVAGLEHVKRFIQERMIEPLLYPSLAARYRLKLGGGILLFGPPGTGKTRIAQATAAELEAEWVEITPSVIRGFPGDAEHRLEKIFEKALRSPRVVIFLDEAEALLAQREDQASTVIRRVVPVLLDLFSRVSARRDRPVLIIAATNRPWDIDEAFLRPGRLDVRLFAGLPDQEAREEIIRINLKERPHTLDGDSIRRLAERLEGWTGADIEALLDQVALECYRRCPKPQADEELPRDLEPIRLKDVEALASQKRPSVTPEDLQKYEEWNARYGTAL